MLLGRTTLASRVFDVLRAVRFLTELERAADGVALRGYGTAALWGYLAAALEQRIHTVHVSGMLPSWQEVVDTRLLRFKGSSQHRLRDVRVDDRLVLRPGSSTRASCAAGC